MAIYIKGVAIPTNCTDCRYRPLVGCNPYQDNGLSPSDHRHRTCPLTEVAEPHGRLIDADALADDLETDGKEFESGKRVIEHLKQMPSAVCDDCIWHVCNYNKVDWDTPSAEAVQGEWICKGDYAVCSKCGGSSGTQFDGVEPIPKTTAFCPNCGARMKGGDDE